jgi:hypothetical protein
MSVTLDYKCAARTMREKLGLSSDGGDSGSKKCKRNHSGASDEVCDWQESSTSRRKDVLTFDLLYI